MATSNGTINYYDDKLMLCYYCEQYKPIVQFLKDRRSIFGKQHKCKECTKNKVKAKYDPVNRIVSKKARRGKIIYGMVGDIVN